MNGNENLRSTHLVMHVAKYIPVNNGAFPSDINMTAVANVPQLYANMP